MPTSHFLKAVRYMLLHAFSPGPSPDAPQPLNVTQVCLMFPWTMQAARLFPDSLMLRACLRKAHSMPD
jgi:hypothetical protein